MNINNILPVPFRFVNTLFSIADYLEKNSLNLFNQMHQVNDENGIRIPNHEESLATLRTIFESCAKIKADLAQGVLHPHERAEFDLVVRCQVNFLNKQFEHINSICRDIMEPAECELN